MGVANAGQNNPGDRWIIPDRIPSPMGTGAGQGSPGGKVSASAGDLATVVVSVPGQSSQVPPDMGRVDYNDTSGMSSDNPNLLFVSGEDQSSAAWSAGTSHVHPRNPNASGPGAGAGAA